MVIEAIVLWVAVLVVVVGMVVEYRQTRRPAPAPAGTGRSGKVTGFRGFHGTTVLAGAGVAAVITLATASARGRSVPVSDLAFNAFLLGIAADRLSYLVTLRGWPAGGSIVVARVIAGTFTVVAALALGLGA